jgi:DNA-binding NtrC family response regulator
MGEPAQKPQIMIVADSADVASLLAAHVELNGLEPVKANSAQECIDSIESGAWRIKVAVINGNIALERGGLLVSKIKQADPNIGIVVVANEESDRSRLLRLGCEDFTKTPVSVQTIISKVLMLVAKDRQN